MSDIQSLLGLQELDGHIRVLQQEIKDIPKRKEQEASRLQNATAAVEQAKGELRAAQVKVAETELEVKARQDKILSIKQTQGMLKTNKEFHAYNLEIAKIEAEIDTYEARLIIALDDVIPRKHALAEREAKLREGQASVDAYLAELDARLAEVRGELAVLETARGEAAKKVQPRALMLYDRLQLKRWPAVVPLQADGVCNGCHLRLPPSVAQQVRRGQDLIFCEMCGRILYM